MISTSQNGKIVEEGLYMYLDAINPKSYPGAGSTWFDLTDNKNNFTLVNSPTYNGLALTFNGSNQYAQCVNNTFGNFGSGSFTMEYVAYVSAAPSQAAIIMKRNQSTNIGQGGNPGICDRVGANECYVQDDNGATPTGNRTNIITVASMTVGSQSHMVYTIERNGFEATGSRYLNGRLTTTQQKTFIGSNLIDNANTMLLMLGSAQYVAGNLYLVRFYDRVLSQTEVLQNFNATKSRFKL